MKFNHLKAGEQKEIKEILSSLGLKDKEQIVYLALLETGPLTITPLARYCGLRPTTVESVATRLFREGYATATKRKSRHVYEATDLAGLKKILERHLYEIIEAAPLFQKLKSGYTTEAKVRIYHRERVADIFMEAIHCKSKLIYEMVAAYDLQEIIGEKLHFSRRRKERGTRLKSLRVESREIKKYSPETNTRELRETKFLPRELTFSASFMWWDTTIAIFTTKGEGTAVVIESPVLTTAMRQLFELLWSISRPMLTA